MKTQSKQDLVAAGATAIMFLGAFILPASRLGLVALVAGAIVMLLLMLNALR